MLLLEEVGMSAPEVLAGVDVVVIGAGAAGAAVGWRLASHGAEVVCLEQGGWITPESVPSLTVGWERARARTHHPNPNVRMNAWDYPVDDSDAAIKPLLYNAVGGSTVHWGAHFPRMKPSDFKVHTLDGIGVDWPIDYADLAAYFEINDEQMGVAGLAGDPSQPPRGPRTCPPVPLGPGARRLAAAYNRLGWHWWPVDAAILTRDRGSRSACNNCGPCDLGCPRDARASTDAAYWPAALAAGVQLRTEARVLRIESVEGHVTGVLYADAQGRSLFQPAGRVVMAANGLGTARLLLLSAAPWCPTGLANSSDMVGRHLMHHPTGMVTGVFDEPLEGYAGPFAVSIFSQEFYETDPARGFLRGFQAQTIRSDGPLGTALGGYLPTVEWGSAHHEDFRRQFGHTASITVTTEDLPDPDNRVTLSQTLKDRWGVPAPKMTYRVEQRCKDTIAFGIERNAEVLREAGAVDIMSLPLVESAGFHLLGTARMGTDPTDSVVDSACRAHDVDNLWIVDGSVFATAGALNPTSTIQAIALRAADVMAGRPLLRGEFNV
jgi:choline dehydrogenase-like flavoprotein